MNPFKPGLRPATERDVRARWSSSPDGLRFRCGLCGHRFAVGDLWRGVMANVADSPTRMGNFFVCEACDGPDADVLAKRAELELEAGRRFWWLIDYDSTLRRLDERRAEQERS